MPELPEVETVRQGLADHLLHRRIDAVEVYSPRAVRRLPGGAAQLAEGLVGATTRSAVRRGKFAWLLLDERSAAGGGAADAAGPADRALLVHLGMSGQLLVREPGTLPDDDGHPHLRVRLVMHDGGALDFVDQRTFGYLSVEPLVATPDALPGGFGAPDPVLPAPVAHIARDLLDPAVDIDVLGRVLRRRRSAVKRALLDQTLVSGVGNIYADEALWRAQVHPERSCEALTARAARDVLVAAREVMAAALVAGGTSFDSLYVNVNGASGYFDRSLQAYGRTGEPCQRCGTAVVRLAFTNRSSHICPRCQRAPRVVAPSR